MSESCQERFLSVLNEAKTIFANKSKGNLPSIYLMQTYSLDNRARPLVMLSTLSSRSKTTF